MAQDSLKLSAVIVGCGNIASVYADQIGAYEHVDVTGFCDLIPERAVEFGQRYQRRAYASLEEVLADPKVDLIINLTIHHVHAEVIAKCLEAGKHVHTEKPLAMRYAEARDLVAMADRGGLRLSSAPSTYLGEAAQTCGKFLREGRLGTPRLAYAEMNHGRIESWHPNPAPFYAVGPVWDVAVYPLGVWCALCGPVRRVSAYGKILLPDRTTKEGTPFSVGSPEFVTAVLDFESGMTARLTANFYVSRSRQGSTMEFHGDAGSLFLSNNLVFNAEVEFSPSGNDFAAVDLVRPGFQGVELARGVQDLAEAILEGRPHRCDAGMAAHVVEVVEAIHDSHTSKSPVEVRSSFRLPDPMPWAR